MSKTPNNETEQTEEKQNASETPGQNSGDESPTQETKTDASDEKVVNISEADKKEEADPVVVLETALTQSKEELLYLQAEFENFKKRTQKEKQQSILFANEKFVHELLPILENFELALQHGEKLSFEEKSEEANFLTGVKLTHQSLTKMLNSLGVQFIGVVGEAFDPMRHEALSIEEKEDEREQSKTSKSSPASRSRSWWSWTWT